MKADLRRAVRQCRKEILHEHEFSFLVQVADQLFSGPVLEEKVAAIFSTRESDRQVWRCRIQAFRIVARPNQQLG